jgi:glucokinase
VSGLAAGIDLGGTKMLGVVLDEAGGLVREVRWATPSGAEAILDGIAALARELGPWETLGVGAAGLVTTSGVLRAAPNLPRVAELDVAGELGRRLDGPVSVDNDATCATLAEWRLGAGAGGRDLVLVTLGTGIGGGLVMGGRLQRGANGFAGEPGHMVVDPDGPLCVCGKRGCWERYASGSGIARMAREAIAAGALGEVAARAGGIEAVRGEDVEAAARAGDADALAVLDQFAAWTALGLVNLANILDPEALLVGGGLATMGELLIAPVRRHFGNLLYAAEHRPRPRVELAALGERAGAIGAALLPQVVV